MADQYLQVLYIAENGSVHVPGNTFSKGIITEEYGRKMQNGTGIGGAVREKKDRNRERSRNQNRKNKD